MLVNVALCFADVVSVWLPQIFQSSAYFTYANKGLWVLIMAQLGMEIYVSDQSQSAGFLSVFLADSAPQSSPTLLELLVQ